MFSKSRSGFPIDIDSNRANSTLFCSTKSANFNIQCERWAPVNLLHGPVEYAAFAAATASSISFSPATCTSLVIIESSKGFWTVKDSTELEVTNFWLLVMDSRFRAQEHCEILYLVVNK